MMAAILSFLLLTFLPPDLRPFHDAIYQLGSPKFAVREAASRKLRETRDDQVIPLLREAAKDEDLERRIRARDALYSHYERILVVPGRDVPWILCLPKDFPDRSEVLQKYRPKIDYTNDYSENDFNEERDATWTLIVDLLDQGKDFDYCKDMLDKMWKNEMQWTEDGKKFRWSYNEIPEFDN